MSKIFKETVELIKSNNWIKFTYILLNVLTFLILCIEGISIMWVCFLTVFLLFLLPFLQVLLKIQIPSLLNVIIMLFIFGCEVLGEVYSFYYLIPYWDNILHLTSGFVTTGIGIAVINKRSNSIFLVIVFGFCFSMTIGVFWEIFEYLVDTFLLFDMQKDTFIYTLRSGLLGSSHGNTVANISNVSEVIVNGVQLQGYIDIGLIDTMHDLIINLIGCVLFIGVSFINIPIFSSFIPKKHN